MALALAAGAGAHAVSAPAAATALGPTSCPGAAIQPSLVITGEFASELQGSFVLLPFQVPAGTTAVRVKYCWDPPLGPRVFITRSPAAGKPPDTIGGWPGLKIACFTQVFRPQGVSR